MRSTSSVVSGASFDAAPPCVSNRRADARAFESANLDGRRPTRPRGFNGLRSLRGQTGGFQHPSDDRRGVDLEHDGVLGRDLTEGAEDRESGGTEGGDGGEVEAG